MAWFYSATLAWNCSAVDKAIADGTQLSAEKARVTLFNALSET
jgi:hypothetical protein